jgi:UDP-2,3-diacylglucosamine pyrophosphatase LpxH
MATSPAEYQRQITKGLERTFKTPSHTMSKELGDLRIFVVSDLHRGVRDGADDFRKCERAYNAALAYHYAAGYTLLVLGDAEELWECRPGPVIEKYKHTFGLEAKYRRAGRYWRIWGNHDDLWADEKAVQKHLGSVGLDGPVWESLRLEVTDQGTRLGELFFVHGHQGTMASDKYGKWSRLFVRYVWRNVQRMTGWGSTTPARDWKLRQKHDAAMYRWAVSKRDQGVILFAGHTHRPVFRAESLVDQLIRKLELLEQRLDEPGALEERRNLEAELEWVRSGQFQTPPVIDMEAPCYFNTGCGSFSDGDVTGLAIADGQIQLVRWPDDADRPLPQVLNEKPADLRRCFAEVRGLVRKPEEEVHPPQPSAFVEEPVIH